MSERDQGIRVRPEDTLLVERALDFLAAGPAPARLLVERVCQMPGVSPVVAEQMAAALLLSRPEFRRRPDGQWELAASAPRDGEAGTSATALAAAPGFEAWLERRRGAEAEVGAAVSVPERGRRRTSRAAPAAVREVPPPDPAGDGADDPCADGAPLGRAPDGGPDELLTNLSYVVVDVETTGGRPYAGDRVTEIAAVAVRNGEIAEVYETLVNPQRAIPPMITAITNITWEMVRDQPTFREICPDVVTALRGNIFVAHNVTFDWKFVTHEISRASGEQLDGRRLCTVRLARRLLPQLPRRSLDWVARHYGVDIPRAVRHRAAGDAIATAHVLLGLLRDAADRGVTTWRDLDVFLGARAGGARRRRTALPRTIDKDTTA